MEINVHLNFTVNSNNEKYFNVMPNSEVHNYY